MGPLRLEFLETIRLPAISIPWNVVVAYGFGILILYAAARLLAFPMRFAARLLANTLAGVALLFAFNLAGSFFGVRIPLNPITALLAGALGVPGLALLLALKYFILP